MSKNHKGYSKKLIILVAVAAAVLAAAMAALKFYSDITSPEDLFDPSSVAAPTAAPVASFEPAATAAPTPTPNPDDVLSAQADQELMSSRTNILVLGIDQSVEREDWGSFRTDTMILVSIDFSNNDVCMVSIPRDSYVKIYDSNGELANPEEPMDKINNAFSEGGGAQRNGFAYTMATVEGLMGVSVDYYCAFNMNVVKEVVDAMGGVDYYVDVEVDMNGRSYQIGQQHLTGQGVLDYCRQRRGSSDIARIDRQQRMLTAILEKLKSTDQIVNLPSIYTAVENNILTNLSFKQICSLSLVALRMDMDQLTRHTVKGAALDVYGRNCWCIRAGQLEDLVEEVWGARITVDPEIDHDYILAQMELNRQLIGPELNAAYSAYSKVNALLENYEGVIDGANYELLEDCADGLEDAIEKENRDLLIAYTQPAEQLCYSICNQYGIRLY